MSLRWPGIERSGFPCLGCCPCNPTSDKQKKMDGYSSCLSHQMEPLVRVWSCDQSGGVRAHGRCDAAVVMMI